MRNNGIREDGHPYSYKNDNALISDLPQEEQDKAIEWVGKYCREAKALNRNHTSYGLKDILAAYTGYYITNNQFKDLMLLCGYRPKNENEQNWEFFIREAPIKQAQRDGEKARSDRRQQ